jgi:hypothetical protein
VKEYNLVDLSPSSMKDFMDKAYNDTELASLYKWNGDRRASPRPNTPLHSKEFSCNMQSTETFEYDDCMGRPHIQPLSKFDPDSYMEDGVANWIQITK